MTVLHILRPRGYYIGQVRPEGYRLWRTVTGNCRSAEAAMAKAMKHMRGMKRARVLFCDTSGYYDPNLSMEAHHV